MSDLNEIVDVLLKNNVCAICGITNEGLKESYNRPFYLEIFEDKILCPMCIDNLKMDRESGFKD